MFTEKEMKLWRLALDAQAQKGEIDNAAIAILKSLRSRNFKAETLTSVVKPEPKPKPKPEKHKPDPGDIVFQFGKHKGKMIREVPPDYLHWIHRWIDEGDADLQKKFGWLKKSIEEYWNG